MRPLVQRAPFVPNLKKCSPRKIGIVWFTGDRCALSLQHTACQPFTPGFKRFFESIYFVQGEVGSLVCLDSVGNRFALNMMTKKYNP